ncbi:MAG: hypothetical protein KY475_02250 [Planctomycetes bacterium]|nr:hypothetical protein [Planctomycetota bacterium]
MTDAASSRSRKPATGKNRPRKLRPAPDRRREAITAAEELYEQRPDWVVFFREIFGVGGVVPRLFPPGRQRDAFEKSAEYGQIQEMLAELRRIGPLQIEVEDREPMRMITVRLPRSMHEALRSEAAAYRTSMNKLCIAKLVRALDELQGAEEELIDEIDVEE